MPVFAFIGQNNPKENEKKEVKNLASLFDNASVLFLTKFERERETFQENLLNFIYVFFNFLFHINIHRIFKNALNFYFFFFRILCLYNKNLKE